MGSCLCRHKPRTKLMDLPREVLGMIEDRVPERERGGMMAVMVEAGLGLHTLKLTGVWKDVCQKLGVKESVRLALRDGKTARVGIKRVMSERERTVYRIELDQNPRRDWQQLREIADELCNQAADCVVRVANLCTCDCEFYLRKGHCKDIALAIWRFRVELMRPMRVRPAAFVFEWPEQFPDLAKRVFDLFFDYGDGLQEGHRQWASSGEAAFYNCDVVELWRYRLYYLRPYWLCVNPRFFVVNRMRDGRAGYGLTETLNNANLKLE